jgi:TonB family protein
MTNWQTWSREFQIQGPSRAEEGQLRRLWRDKPEYAAFLGATHTKTIRIVSVAVPKYPYWQAWAKKRAEVSASFIVGIDGKVEDAREYESSDSRFDQPALDAIQQFVFIPAEGTVRSSRESAGGPAISF